MNPTTTSEPSSSMFREQGDVEVRQETVVFHEDGDVVVNSDERSFDTSFIKGASDGLENSVKDFLARPVLVSEFTWLAADAPMTEKFNINFPSAWFARPMISQKLSGFRYFRGELVVRMQLNAQPFNAGRLLMYFVPFKNTQQVVPTNEQHFGGITGYHHVDSDVAETTAVELRIPYMSPFTHIDMVKGYGEMGNVVATVYSQLTGGEDIEGSVWAHFENVSLEMPTGLPLHVYTRLDKTRESYHKIMAQSQDAPNLHGLVKKLEDKGKEYDAKRSKAKDPAVKKDPVNKKAEAKKGDFQSLFDAQSTIASKMGSIPVIGPIMSGLGWLTNAASGIAGIFGFSKPTNPDFETGVTQRVARGFTNFNSKSLAKPMGLDSGNAIVQPSGTFCTDKDEMALACILQKPVYCDRFSMKTDQGPGTELWRWPVCPDACIRTVDGASTVENSTYLSFLSTLFEYWRGTIEYTFKIVKTPFHSGRVRILFVPGADLDTDFALVDRDKTFAMVVDIRDTTEHCFSVPYVNNNFFSENFHGYAALKTGSVPTGMVYVEVLNTLKTAGQADTTIEFLVETNAGEDFQFGFLGKEPTYTVKYNPLPTPRIVAQVNAEPIFQKQDLNGFDANTVSMGEAIVSLRQVLKRVVAVENDPQDVANALMIPSLVSSTAEATGTVSDLFTYISSIYRMLSGGMRYTFIPQTSSDVTDTYMVLTAGGFDAIAEIPTLLLHQQCGYPIQKFYSEVERVMEIDVPWYQRFQALPTSVGYPPFPLVNGDNFEVNKVPFNYGTNIALTAFTPVTVYRSIGEDFSFGYLIGPPQVLHTSPTPRHSSQ